MTRRIRFEDAARLLGEDNSALLSVLDMVAGAGLVAAAPLTGGASIGWVDVKNDLMRLLGELRLRIGPRLRGTAGVRRSHLLAAAHAVLVVSAFFDAAEAAGVLARVKLSRDDTVNLAGAVRADPRGADLVGGLLRAEVPVPGPQRPYLVLVEELRRHYRQMGGRLAEFLTGLAFWDRLSETDRDDVVRRLTDEVPAEALHRYEQNLGQFARDCPEFVFWTNLWEHAATREAVRQALPATMHEQLDTFGVVLRDMRSGLDGLASLLGALGDGSAAAEPRWRELARVYDEDVRCPVVDPGDPGTPRDVSMPSLLDSYVNPAIRIAEAAPGDQRPAEPEWWRTRATVADLQGFFVGHLTSPAATELPLLVLGSPGAGKSVLTRVLAARLGAVGHRPVRIDLSRVPADASILEQIEAGLRTTLARAVQWGELADAAGDMPPVIMLDGFDELLQGSPNGRWDYLEQVREFQRAQAARGRPVAVMVTSRTVVAHRVRIPPGATIVALEPFDEVRVGGWLARWNDSHAEHFAAAGLRVLSTDAVLRHRQLAEQPLLLLMLAMYDLNDNALQAQRGELASADLYERLLYSFVVREVRKSRAFLDDERLAETVEAELYKLAVAAFGMVNRASQYLTPEALDADLRALDAAGAPPTGTPHGQPLSDAESLVGRFYFMHVSRAVADPDHPAERQWRTYEFLHATFGDYLAARLAADELAQLPATGGHRGGRHEPDDALLRALLSWQPLTGRGQVVAFLPYLTDRDPAAGPAAARVLRRLLRTCLTPTRSGRYADYRPAVTTEPLRYATYSLNLVVLLLAVHGGRLPLAEVFDDDPPDRWRRLAMLWHATLDAEVWQAVLDEVSVTGPAGAEQVLLVRAGHPPGLADQGGRRGATPAVVDLYRDSVMLRDPALTDLLAAVGPLASLGADLFRPARVPGGSPAAALLALVCGDIDTAAFRACLTAAATLPAGQRGDYLAPVVRHVRLTQTDRAGAAIGEVVVAAREVALADGDIPLLAEVVETAAAHLGRDAALDAVLGETLRTAAERLSGPHLGTLDPTRRLRITLVLAESGTVRATDPTPYALGATLAQLDVGAVAGHDAQLLARVLRAARAAGLDGWLGTTAPGLLAALSEPVRAALPAGEVAYTADQSTSHQAS